MSVIPCGRMQGSHDPIDKETFAQMYCSKTKLCPNCTELLALRLRVAELEATAAKWKALAEECAGDLEDEMAAKYSNMLDYPSQRRRYERDIESAKAVRAAAGIPEGK